MTLNKRYMLFCSTSANLVPIPLRAVKWAQHATQRGSLNKAFDQPRVHQSTEFSFETDPRVCAKHVGGGGGAGVPTKKSFFHLLSLEPQQRGSNSIHKTQTSHPCIATTSAHVHAASQVRCSELPEVARRAIESCRDLESNDPCFGVSAFDVSGDSEDHYQDLYPLG